ncbi:MAG: PUA domain-containing protein [Candidatus Nanoarchaeia archaeon]
MKRRRLSKSDIKELNKIMMEKYHVEDYFHKKGVVDLIDDTVIYHGSFPCFFYDAGNLVPTLRLVLERGFPIKKVTVDMGAVKFVVSGADIMRPGIVRFDSDIQKYEYVAVVDENNHKPLAIGRMLFSGDEAQEMKSGKVVKSVHYVGDELWTASTI